MNKILLFLAGGLLSFSALWASDEVTVSLHTSLDPVPFEFYVKYMRDANSGTKYSGNDFLTNQIYDSSLDLSTGGYASYFYIYLAAGGNQPSTTDIAITITDSGFVRDEDGGSGENTVPTAFSGIYGPDYNIQPSPISDITYARSSDYETLTYGCTVAKGYLSQDWQLCKFSLTYSGVDGSVLTGVYRDEITINIEMTTGS